MRPVRTGRFPRSDRNRSGPLRNDQGQKVVKPKGRLLAIQEAADYLGMSRASLAGRGWRIKNRLPAIKIGRAVRFDLQMLDRWIERHRNTFPGSCLWKMKNDAPPDKSSLHVQGRNKTPMRKMEPCADH